MDLATSYYQLNRGLVSKLGLARMDIKRTAISAAVMTNFVPRVLGSMMLRPGMAYKGNTKDDAFAVYLDFVFSTDDTALIELTDQSMRVWVNDAVISRPAVTSAVTNGNFSVNLVGWTATGGATWVAPGYAQFVGNGTTDETLDQTVAVAGGNIGVLHALRIVIARGPVKIRVGTAAGDENYVTEATLETGTHSLAFTPTGNFTIRFFSALLREVWVDSCNVEGVGILVLPTPWLEADLYSVRSDQSGDVLFVSCSGQGAANYQQRRIERRANNSWSVVLYQTVDGPYRTENTGPITLTPSGPSGNITVTASSPLFTTTQVGGLYSITQQGQFVTVSAAAANTFTDPVQVVGVDEQRRYAFTVTGVFVATVTVQRSVGVIGNWIDVSNTAAPTSGSDKDGLDNQIVYYRIGIKAGDYVSGTAVCSLTYNIGRIRGVVRITSVTSPVIVNVEVLKNLGANLVATDIWSEGSWSDRRGWPTAGTFYEGRLWWSGKNGIYGSKSDAFDDYSPDIDGTAGAAGTINRTIGSGPVDNINWLLPLQRLIIGAEGTEFSARSTAFDEPLSPTNFNIKGSTTQGSANVVPVKVDSRGVFVQRSGTRVYELALGGNSYDYDVTDMTALIPEMGEPSIVSMAVQRQPDTRVHAVRSDGKVALAVIDHVEQVLSWQLIETDGEIEDVVVLPGALEDQVYYSVKRTIPATVASLSLVSNGSFYPVTGVGQNPTLTITPFLAGHGAGAAAVVLGVGIFGGSVAFGAGYTAGDVITAVGGSFTVAAQITVNAVNGAGAVTALTISQNGIYTDPFGAGASFTGGTGAGFAFNSILQAGITSMAVTFAGSGYDAGARVTVNSPFAAYAASASVNAIIADDVARHLNRWALESECVGGTLNKQADSFITYSGIPTATITGLGPLEGFEVVVWGDGVDMSPDDDTGVQRTYTVTQGQITLDTTVHQAIAGIPYTAQWQSTKLAFALPNSMSWLNQRKALDQLGLVMANVHSQGVKYGPDFDHLDPLPKVEDGAIVDYDTVWEEFDKDMMEFDGIWSTDSRVCIQCQAPRPCTVLAITMAVEEHGKS